MTFRRIAGVVGLVFIVLGLVGIRDGWLAEEARLLGGDFGATVLWLGPGISTLGLVTLAWTTKLATLERARRVRIYKAMGLTGIVLLALAIVPISFGEGGGLVFFMTGYLVGEPGLALLLLSAPLLVLDDA